MEGEDLAQRWDLREPLLAVELLLTILLGFGHDARHVNGTEVLVLGEVGFKGAGWVDGEAASAGRVESEGWSAGLYEGQTCGRLGRAGAAQASESGFH